MSIQYQTYMALNINNGDDINIEGVNWICVEPCTLIGCTIEGNIPVISGPDGPMLNRGHFLERGSFKTLPKSGQSRTEVLILAEYEEITVDELPKKSIKFAYQDECCCIIVCEDKTYFKLVIEYDYDESPRFSGETITIDELKTFGLLTDAEWESHLEDSQTVREQAQAVATHKAFQDVVRRIGVNKAKELLGMTNETNK